MSIGAQVLNSLDMIEDRFRRARRVLVVDDQDLVAETLCHMLTAFGCEVEKAEDCSSAMEKLASSHFDLVFIDYRMPGKNGIECAMSARRLFPDVKWVLWTGFPEGLCKEDVQKMGFLTLLTKPVGIEDLQRLVRSFSL